MYILIDLIWKLNEFFFFIFFSWIYIHLYNWWPGTGLYYCYGYGYCYLTQRILFYHAQSSNMVLRFSRA